MDLTVEGAPGEALTADPPQTFPGQRAPESCPFPALNAETPVAAFRMKVHLVDGTYELFGLRCAVAQRSDFTAASGRVRPSHTVSERLGMRVCALDSCPLFGGGDVGDEHVGLQRTRLDA